MIKDREREQAEARAKAREEKLEQKKEALARQKALEDKYFNSPLTRKIIEAISDGTGRLPEEITIMMTVSPAAPMVSREPSILPLTGCRFLSLHASYPQTQTIIYYSDRR